MTTDQGFEYPLQLLVQVAHLDGGILPYTEPVNLKKDKRENEKAYSVSLSISKRKVQINICPNLKPRRQYCKARTVVMLFNFL